MIDFGEKKVPVRGAFGLFHINWHFYFFMGELELGDAASSAARALFRGKTTQGGAPCLVTDPVFFCACDERCGESRGGRGGGACLCLCLCLENYCAVLTARFLLPAR